VIQSGRGTGVQPMMGERRVGQDALFYEFSLERHVPSEHLVRSIDRFVDLAGVRCELAPFYSEMGRPSMRADWRIWRAPASSNRSHVKSLPAHAVRSLVIARKKLVGQRVTLENQIRGLAVVFGVRLPRALSSTFISQALQASDGIPGLSAAMRVWWPRVPPCSLP